MTRACGIGVLLLAAAQAGADELRVLGGKVVSGKTTAISAGEIVIQAEGGEVKTPLGQALALDFRPAKGIPAGAKYMDVRLVDDTILHCQAVEFLGKPAEGKDKRDQVELTLLSGAKLKLPLDFITWFVRDGHNAALMKQWDAMVTEKVRSDRVVLLKKEGLDPGEGTLGTVNPKEKTIAFTREGTTIQARLENIHGLIFFRPEPPGETPLCRVHDAQGNVMTAASLTYKGAAFELVTTFGAKVALAADAVARIDFNMGKLAFLSDMEPGRVVEKSKLGLVEPYRRDTNLDGQPIQLDRAYAKGLSMHAYTELDYNLAGKFKEFKAVLGVDARVGTASQAKVTIYCDGAMRFSETVTAKVRPIMLDVKGVTTLRIVVSSPDFFGLGDHATLADAQVSK
jgi:hypothetical protein